MNSVHHCHNCLTLRHQVEKQEKHIVQLQQEVQRLMKLIWNKEEFVLRSEIAELSKKLNRSVKWLNELTGRYFEQEKEIKKLQKNEIESIKVIKKLQKNEIERIGKVLISYIYNQIDES